MNYSRNHKSVERAESVRRYDVMRGINCPARVLQWATAEEVDAFLVRTGLAIYSDRQIGRVLHEITVARAIGASA